MPGTAVVEVYGDEMVAEELIQVGSRGADLTPFWPRVVETIQQAEREQFATQGARGPRGPWPELSERWMWHKFQNGMSLEILKATEAMFNALTGMTADSIAEITMDKLEFGADLPQFGFQQAPGTDAPYPPRYPVDLTDVDIHKITQGITAFITGRFAGAEAGVPGGNVYYNTKSHRWQNRSSGQFTKGPMR